MNSYICSLFLCRTLYSSFAVGKAPHKLYIAWSHRVNSFSSISVGQKQTRFFIDGANYSPISTPKLLFFFFILSPFLLRYLSLLLMLCPTLTLFSLTHSLTHSPSHLLTRFLSLVFLFFLVSLLRASHLISSTGTQRIVGNRIRQLIYVYICISCTHIYIHLTLVHLCVCLRVLTRTPLK